MNYRNILFYLGINLLFFSIFPIINIIYSIYFDFLLSINDYIFTLVISLSLGSIFYLLGYKNKTDISLIEQITFIILSYLFIPLLISIPFNFSIYDMDFLNSYFESISGFTATGFSTIIDVEDIDCMKPIDLCSNETIYYKILAFPTEKTEELLLEWEKRKEEKTELEKLLRKKDKGEPKQTVCHLII